MQRPRKRIDMYQVVVPPETARKLLSNRNESKECGPMYCCQCHLFFHEKRYNILNMQRCIEHSGKKGFRLVDL